MGAGFFTPDGANTVEARPADKSPSVANGWAKDTDHPGAGNGTVMTATLVNQIIGNLRTLVNGLGGPTDGTDNMLFGALVAGALLKSTYDPNAIEGDAFDMDNMVDGVLNKVLTAAAKAKIDFLTVTAAVDLDAINARLIELDAVIILQGTWDPTTGTFPGGGEAQAGWAYVVSTNGVVDGVEFAKNDRVLAIVDNASETTFDGNWFKQDYTELPQNLFMGPVVMNALFGGL